jgi:hypothetical protein
MGRIIPFELAQKELLAGELAALKAHEDRLAEISGSYEEALDGLSEEDKEADFVNEDKTAFVWAEVKKTIKAKEVEPEVLAALKKVFGIAAFLGGLGDEFVVIDRDAELLPDGLGDVSAAAAELSSYVDDRV